MGMTAKRDYEMTKTVESLKDLLFVGLLQGGGRKSRATGYEPEIPGMVKREFRV
ncbi:hypothetical protein [Acidaminococcus timonensis]|uniref:hypothetical protein n=1 Tax=Acidaminococcus timonensis TaxID=1871002 RepID=UPI0013563972|nr:hypothetical protein [Acidaminococcus timonensis]